jgi:hypothetical protein
LVLDSVSSPITRRVYDLGLDEFIAWYGKAPRTGGFTKATVTAWRVALEARKLGPISINVRITAVRRLAVEAADNGLLAPELAFGTARIKGVRSHGVRIGLAVAPPGAGAPERAGRPHEEGTPRQGHVRRAAGLQVAPIRTDEFDDEARADKGQPLVHRGFDREARPGTDDPYADVDEERDRRLDIGRGCDGGASVPARQMLKTYISSAGLQDIAPYDLRRTTAKLCRAAGGELAQIQLVLGHSSVQTTERYLGTKSGSDSCP